MFKNFFRTAIRSILKNKAYALINFIGLTCGLALALLIITYVSARRSAMIVSTNMLTGCIASGMWHRTRLSWPSPPPIAPRMKEYFPEVEETARIYRRNVSISLPEEREAFEETDAFCRLDDDGPVYYTVC